MPKYRRLSENNRKDIQTMFESGATKREIARSIDKSPSTVCRELARNRKRGGQWEKGAVENMNGLVRQYHTKSDTFEELTQREVSKTANKLNKRPRKCLK